MNSIASTTIFSAGDLVRAPFPHVERPVLVPRPALVVSRTALGPNGILTWTLMITNAERELWPGDIAIPDSEKLGLLIPSKVRTAKIAPIETHRASLIGRLDDTTLAKVRETLLASLG
ncbi:type II toxin-antitoxin system PemK/MazF family toxin [Sphingomonas tabacisoli]|uniref:Type II toxin-antitoxin system PemK/MazF family toxin n=1 Tax=Sphingomonas tabacisoli TaxID=2249466 RepID=A0ABW4HYV1_9SPHN